MEKTVVHSRYGIVRTLGNGGMAKVYLAHDDVLGRNVALKVLREQFADDDEFVERFRREARSAAALSHPNIVSVYDRGEEKDGTSYIAMEYVPGGTLKERILASGPLQPGIAASVALQIAEALGAAHERGVIHRDVKPQNVLLTESGEAKVADFGIARAASAATISQRSLVLGTAAYMSPEQALGKPVDPRSDLYSLGVVLYEMLTGELPFEAESPVAVSMKHVNEPPRHPRGANPAVPEGLDTLTVKLLAKDPEDRYENAAELAEDLRRVRDGLPPVSADPARDDTGATRLDTRATIPMRPATAAQGRNRRKMPWILAATLALLALLGSWAFSQNFWGQDSKSEEVGQATGVEVPAVKGLPQERAQQKLADSGFKADVQPRESSAGDAGKVLDQSPAAGERAEIGSRVVIVVGDGPATVKVPDVVGLGLSEAEAALDEAGLTIGLQREVPSNTVPQGVIVEQGYPPGTDVEPGSTVNLGISSGPPQVVAPSQSAQPVPSQPAQPVPSQPAQPVPSQPAQPSFAEEIEEGGEIEGGIDNSGSGSINSGNSGSSGSGSGSSGSGSSGSGSSGSGSSGSGG